jgi:predicted TIM-barrel fold metal-dependent hydrolase
MRQRAGCAGALSLPEVRRNRGDWSAAAVAEGGARARAAPGGSEGGQIPLTAADRRGILPCPWGFTVNRRHFLKSTTAAAAAVQLARETAAAAQRPGLSVAAGEGKLIDTHVYLSRWPFRRLWGDETENLVAKLAEYGVTTALAGSFDGLFHKDISAVNAAIAAECAAKGRGILAPVGSINPTLPDWEEDLRRCHETHRMRVIRLHPNYHRYELSDARFTRLFELAGRRGLTLQVALTMEDERTQSPLMKMARVNPEPLVALLQTAGAPHVMLLNGFTGLRSNRVLLRRLVATGKAGFDLSTLEVIRGIEEVLREHPEMRLLFGSYAPFYYFEYAWLKLKESVLAPTELQAVRSAHAAAMLGAG